MSELIDPRVRLAISQWPDDAPRGAVSTFCAGHGVHDKLRAMGLDPVPSTASLSRIFREAGVARLDPKKKPRSAWRRFVYPAPNACWQLDATEYVLTGGRKVRDLPAHRRPLPLRRRLPRRTR